MRLFDDFGQLVEERERTARASEAALQVRDFFADGSQRQIDLRLIREHHQQLPSRKMSDSDLDDAEQQHRRGSRSYGNTDRKIELRLQPRDVELAFEPPAGTMKEASLLVFFLTEGFHDAARRERL